MRDIEKALADLIRGTAIEDDKDELHRLKKLSLEEQVAVGFVLHAGTHKEKCPNEVGNERLTEVRTVADALRFLDQSRGSP